MKYIILVILAIFLLLGCTQSQVQSSVDETGKSVDETAPPAMPETDASDSQNNELTEDAWQEDYTRENLDESIDAYDSLIESSQLQ